MTPRRPRDIGTAAETAVVRWLQTNGFPNAERRALRGTQDAGDVTGTPGLAWSIKGGHMAKTASDGYIRDWLAALELQRANARADIGILVQQRAGAGPANAGRWWAWMPLDAAFRVCAVSLGYAAVRPAVDPRIPVRLTLADAAALLRAAGYGEPVRGPETASERSRGSRDTNQGGFVAPRASHEAPRAGSAEVQEAP